MSYEKTKKYEQLYDQIFFKNLGALNNRGVL